MRDDGIFQVLKESASNNRNIRGVLRHHHYDIATIIRILDALWVGGLLWLSSVIYDTRWEEHYSFAAVLTMGLFFIIAQSSDLYRSRRGASLQHESVRLWIAWLSVILVLLFIAYATRTSADYSRGVILTWFIVTPVVLTVWRGGLHYMLGALREHGFNTRRVAIVGARELGADFARTILGSPWMGLLPIGFYDDRTPAGARPLVNEPVKVIGDLNALINHARAGKIDSIYITLPMRAEERIKSLLAQLADTTVSVHLVPDFFIYNLMNASWSNLGDLPVVSIYESPFFGVDGWIKRLEDIMLASIILVIIAIPMALIAIGIKLSSPSPGPIIFRQYRYGLRGNRIEVWKFRTMTACENGDDVTQATRHDYRITVFGAFLRRTSLDELPQFINVLQGRMSIVWPRPHAVIHNEQYRKLISGYMLRHKVKPGITGLAQVNGWRGETDTLDKMKRRVEFDLAYIRNWSLFLDLKIIFMTLLRGFGGKSAY